MYHVKEILGRIGRDVKNFWPAALGLFIYIIISNVLFDAFCPMLAVTGIPCPGCGMSRAIVYLITGHPAKSLDMHPLAPLSLILLLYIGWNRYIISRKAKELPVLIGIGVVLLLVCYVFRMYYLFPYRQPLVYMEDNLLSRTLPFYKQILYDLDIL